MKKWKYVNIEEDTFLQLEQLRTIMAKPISAIVKELITIEYDKHLPALETLREARRMANAAKNI